jgi:hypothetical protein
MTIKELKTIYISPQGNLKIPFGFAFSVFYIPSMKLQSNEIRALENMSQFISSLAIMSHRLQEHLSQFKDESWVDVDFDGLFLDTQTFFLFVQQFLEDVSLVTRLTLPTSSRKQMSPTFYKGFVRVIPSLLANDHPLKLFLTQEKRFFLELKDMRDDILHRTSFDRTRLAQFPRFTDFILAAGGKAPFASGDDLRRHISTCMKKIMAFACLCGDYVKENLNQLYPEAVLIGSVAAFITGLDRENLRYDYLKETLAETVEPGTTIVNINPEFFESLMFFLN